MSSNYRTATSGEPEPLFYSTSQAVTGLYVQCQIWVKGELTPSQTIDLTEVAALTGSYEGMVTLTTAQTYNLLYIPYTDSGHTTESEMAPRSSEVMVVRLTADKYGGVRSPGGVMGITENDIRMIAKEVSKQLEKINVWDYELNSGRTAEEELIAKSEFDVKKDMVITQPVVFDYNIIKESIGKEIFAIRGLIPNLKPDLKIISNKIDKQKEVNLTEVFIRLNEIKSKVDSTKVETLVGDLRRYLDLIKEKLPVDNSVKIISETNKQSLSLLNNIKSLRLNESIDKVNMQISNLLTGLQDHRKLLIEFDKLEHGRATKLLKSIVLWFNKILSEVKYTQEIGRVSKEINHLLSKLDEV